MRIPMALRRGTLPFAVLLTLAACDNPVEERDPPTIEITAPLRSVVAGTTLQLSADVTESDGTASTRQVQWQSNATNIATVSSTGLVSGIGQGPATITASVGSTTEDFVVTVLPAPKPTTPQTTFLQFSSTPGDFIGGGQTRRFDFATGSWNAESFGDRNEVRIRYNPGSTIWFLEFAAPQGQPLTVGTYENATRFPFQGAASPGLSLTGEGRGCNTVQGRFTIHDVAIGPQGEVHRLHATFRQHCEGQATYLDGEINILQYPWR